MGSPEIKATALVLGPGRSARRWVRTGLSSKKGAVTASFSLHHPVSVLQNVGSLRSATCAQKDQLANVVATGPLPESPQKWGGGPLTYGLMSWGTAGPLRLQGRGQWRLAPGGEGRSLPDPLGAPLQQPGPSSLGVVRVDGVEEILQLCLIENAICKEELEFLQGQLPIVCKGGRKEGECLVSEP